MQELEFKRALADEMAVVPAPPMMNETEMLTAAKHAVRRRRAMWASGASAAAVVALAVGVAFVAPAADRSAPQVGAGGTSTNPAPDRMAGATATSGPHYEQGVALLDELLGLVPAGFESPDLKGKEGEMTAGIPLRFHQAQRDDDDSWKYDVSIPMAKADKVGYLGVKVTTPTKYLDEIRDAATCELSVIFLGAESNTGASCSEVTVAGKQVGVATDPGRMVVAFWHSDGTLVIVSQGTQVNGYGYPALSELPFTGQQLAELATDPRFHLD